MKTENLKFKTFLLALGLMSLVACGKSNSGSKNGNNVVLNPGVCANCPGLQNPVLLGSFVAESSRPSEFPVSITQGQIFGSGNGGVGTGYPVTGYPTMGYPVNGQTTNNINTYQGAVSVQGVLAVGARIGDEVAVGYGNGLQPGAALPANYQGCILERGNYPMTTAAASQISNGIISNLELVSGTIRLRFEQGLVWRENNQLRLRGTLRIVSVGGRTCAPFFTSIL